MTSFDIKFIKLIRMIRVIRPLRFISTNPSLKCLVAAIMNSLNGILNVCLIITMIWIMFSIVGISLWKNKMNFCTFGNGYYNRYDCIALGGTWTLHYLNFENLLNGLKVLFIVSTLDDWPDYVYWFIDADEINPMRDNYRAYSAYFMIFIFISSFFLINLLMAVVSLNYSMALEKSKEDILDEENK